MSVMMTGTAVAQFVPVLISPILTRIFTPDDFGILTVFLSYSMIASTIISGKYEMAIMLPQKHEEAARLGGLATLLTVLLSSLFMIVLIVFRNSFINLPGAEKISRWLLILPVTAGLVAYGNILNYWVSRNKDFAAISKGKFIQTLSSSSVNIGVGLFSPFPWVLIIGNLLGQMMNAFYLTLVVIRKQAGYFRHISFKQFSAVACKYRKFPFYDIPNSLSYSISTQGMNLFFSRFFGDAVLGYYAMVQRVLITPFSFISLSFTQVFFEKMASVYNNNRDEFNKYLKKAQNRLIVYFAFPFFSFVLLSKFIIPFIFGHDWDEMYRYIFVLSPMIFFTLTTSPYTYIFKIINKQEIALALNIFKMAMLLLVVILGHELTDDPFLVFTFFSVMSVLLTALSILVCLRYLKSGLSFIFKVQFVLLLLLNMLFYFLIRNAIF